MQGKCLHRQRGESGLIQVWQQNNRRSLWFDDVILQTEIYVDDPAVLPNPANRAMLAHLMFGQQPERVLLVGCGGGGIARWFNARSPHTWGDAVEYDPEVTQIAREWFDFPGPQSQWRLHTTDARDYLERVSTPYDFILVDLEEQQYSPQWLTAPPFLQQCHRALTPTGVLTLNLIPDGPNHYTRSLRQIRQVFAQRTLCLPVPDHDNQLVLAFRQSPDLNKLDERVQQAARQWGLPFASYWRQMLKNNPEGSGIL